MAKSSAATKPNPAAEAVMAGHGPVGSAAAAGNAASRAGDKVVVASKLEWPLELQLCETREERRQDRSTVWTEQVSYKVGEIYVINGCAYPRGAPPEGVEYPDPPQKVAGAALTFGIPRDFWERWLEQNKDTAMVRNGLVFAHGKRDGVVGEAREKRDLRSGFEPLRPDATGKDRDARMPRKVRNPLSRRGELEEDDEAALAE